MAWDFVDISKWQGTMNFDVLKSTGVYCLYARSSFNVYTDSQWVRNLAEAKRTGMPIGAYHYLSPIVDGRTQALKFLDVVGTPQPDGKIKLLTDLLPVLDVEERGTATKATLISNIRKFSVEIYNKVGVRPIIYTRATFWDANVGPTTFGENHLVWVAHYNMNINEPWIPDDWKRLGKTWWAWQKSADGNYKGHEYGAQSSHIDLNVVNGGLETLHRMYPGVTFNGDPTAPPEPEPEPDPCVIPTLKVVANAGLNVREQPMVGAHIWFTLPVGEEVEVLEEITSSGNTWVRIGKRQYAAKVYNGTTYLA